MKKILITGATGKQGSAAAYELLKNNFEIYALTRDPQSLQAVSLEKAGAVLIKGDLEDAEGLKDILKKVDGLYLVLPPVWVSSKETDEKEAEIGIQTIRLAKEQGVKFVLYSSVLGSDKQDSFRPKFKFTIEKYLLESGLKASVIRPATFMENLLLPSFGKINGIVGHCLYRVGSISFGRGNAFIIENDQLVLLSQSISHCRIPVIHRTSGPGQ